MVWCCYENGNGVLKVINKNIATTSVKKKGDSEVNNQQQSAIQIEKNG